MRILGIDPGLDAFGCIYQPEASLRSGMRWHFLDIPTSGDKAGRRIDAPKLLEFMADAFGTLDRLLALEGIAWETVCSKNIEKLGDRYKGHKFTSEASQNRKPEE